ncbi:hypothetical protein K435DRAFT_794552 [Dendrothele bispora CBS 962.96]|uniref:C2H2-type domain-containing protein n=1 Tax=Dendrothele bispora (strain CBS 962.96) TaxID=1314807 RepID=A0A4S8MBZ2_DENBC|nr:hypothetical protein K435DRAFT_794552 [Dendrothele bispora CBS 962.96]
MPRSRSFLTTNVVTWPEMTWLQTNTGDELCPSFVSPISQAPDLCIFGTNINNLASMDNTQAEVIADPLMDCQTQPQQEPCGLHHDQIFSSQSAVLPHFCNELYHIVMAPSSYPVPAMHMCHQNIAIHPGEIDSVATGGPRSEMLFPAQNSLSNFLDGEFSQPLDRMGAELNSAEREHRAMHFSNSGFFFNPNLVMIGEFMRDSNDDTHDESNNNPGVQAQPQNTRVATDKLLMVSRKKRKHVAKYNCTLPGCGQDFTAAHNYRNHLNSHEKLRRFLCEKCKKKFSTKIDPMEIVMVVIWIKADPRLFNGLLVSLEYPDSGYYTLTITMWFSTGLLA